MTTDELADRIAQMHADYFRANPRGEVTHTCMIDPGEGEPFLVTLGWQDAAERALTIAALRLSLSALNAKRYAIWSEVWSIKEKRPAGGSLADLEARANAYPPGALAHHPDRVEGVFSFVVERSGAFASRWQRIVRDKRGRVASLEIDAEHPPQMGGALANLFPPPTGKAN